MPYLDLRLKDMNKKRDGRGGRKCLKEDFMEL